MKYALSTIFIIVGLGLIIFTVYRNTTPERNTHTFSSFSVVRGSWEGYKSKFIINEGRVLDFSDNEITTSEGQSYAMLRAVWMDDKETFDKVWNWTKDNLKRPEDNLFIWRYGIKDDGTYGPVGEGAQNSASDASIDISLALIFATQRFNDPSYQEAALPILKDLWDQETGEYDNKRYLVAGNWARGKEELVINPSYFAPYAFRIFADVDKDHDWNQLVDTSYEILEKWTHKSDAQIWLTPDWIVLNRNNGEVDFDNNNNLSKSYGYDAIRTPWRIALDYEWNNEPRAEQYLSEVGESIKKIFERDGKLFERYDVEGNPQSDYESPSMYATTMSLWGVSHPDLSKNLYEEKIKRLYSNDTRAFNSDIQYYEQNWLWFASALYEGYIVNLYAK